VGNWICTHQAHEIAGQMSARCGKVVPAMDHFGEELRRLRQAAGLSLRSLAERVAFDYSYLAQVERGSRPGSAKLAQQCDEALGTGTKLARLFSRSRDVPETPPRRAVLQAMTVLAGGVGTPLASLEATRQGLAAALGDVPDADEWEAIVATHAREYFTVAPADLLPELSADLLVLQRQLGARKGRNTALARSAGQLGVIQAMTLAGLGQRRAAGRWWQTARSAADLSGDPETRAWVRGWAAVNGLYEHRPMPQVLGLIEEALSITKRPCAGVAQALAGRAQAMSLVGDAEAAGIALRELAALTERMPAAVLADDQSLFGWPEYRLRHTESYTYSRLGETAAAYVAQDRCFDLYPPELAREQAKVQLHRARCMVIDGDIGEGIGYAMCVLIELPERFHNQMLYEIGSHVADAVPANERHRPALADLRLLVNRATPERSVQ
jgi:transcriptional regulator with XRE-family HTH domain